MRDLLRTALDIEVESADALAETAASAEERAAWAEHGNRLHVFRLFQYSDHVLGDVDRMTLDQALDAASRLDPYERVWVTEGIGYRLRRPPAECPSLPAASLVPLHAGMGLSIAARWLQRAPDSSMVALVAGVADEGGRASRRGCERVTWEALGLAVRTLAPQLAARFDAAVGARSTADRACFWHGFGRGSYFAISNWDAIGLASARVVDSIRTLASDRTAELNALAGFAWAVTMVNLRSPEVLDAYVPALLDPGGSAAAIADGVESALIVWQHAAPDDDGVERLLAYRACRLAADDHWNVIVRPAALSARARYPAVAAEGRIQDVFQYSGV
jgi:hypothetical protein